MSSREPDANAGANSPDDSTSNELAFLVTHWLASYGQQQQQQQPRLSATTSAAAAAADDDDDTATAEDERQRKAAAVQRVRRAAAELASAFSTLGAFGTTVRPTLLDEPFSSSSYGSTMMMLDDYDYDDTNNESSNNVQNATFADAKRQWSTTCPPNQLERVVQSARAASALVEGLVESNQQQQQQPASNSNSNTSAVTLLAATASTNLLQASQEQARKPGNPNNSTGRTLDEAIELVEDDLVVSVLEGGETETSRVSLGLQPTVLLRAAAHNNYQQKRPTILQHVKEQQAVSLASDWTLRSNEAANAVRHYLDVRQQWMQQQLQIQSVQRSLRYQERSLEQFVQQRAALLLPTCTLDASAQLDAREEITRGEFDCRRVTAQLQQQLVTTLEPAFQSLETQLPLARRTALSLFARVRDAMQQGTRDPFYKQTRTLTTGRNSGSAGTATGNRLLLNLVARESGMDRSRCFGGGRYNNVPRSMGGSGGERIESYRALVASRLSHAVTINTHLHYPVYCLRLDRTGRYFITGADDYLVRVFCLSGYTSNSLPTTRGGGKQSLFNHQLSEEKRRGAVLVCTLRGHAGVINDIDVSSDNSFLATASEDGDCRIWGLKDGCPIAILRGHVGGANMVSWSTLTPYRLVTTGADGFARTWDVREACLKRYRKFVGQRPEYRLDTDTATAKGKKKKAPPQQQEDGAQASSPLDARANRNDDGGLPVPPLPPPPGQEDQQQQQQGGLVPQPPLREEAEEEEDDDEEADAMEEEPPQPPGPPPLPLPVAAIPLPPLPPAQNGNNEILPPGQFVANDMIDEGVKLLSKLRHGENQDDIANAAGGVGTRSRRSPVKVICVVRCPHGGHFATGSDDGVCRVWRDEDDSAVKAVDDMYSVVGKCLREKTAQHEAHHTNGQQRQERSSTLSSKRLLMTLKGHTSAVTDLQYSSTGDRLLTASQKDGEVRIWSWTTDPAAAAFPVSSVSHHHASTAPALKYNQILIKLKNPSSCCPIQSGAHGRRRPNRSSTSQVSCDVAAWTCDATKVITSQCELVKQSGTDIIPGSQFLFIWDSSNGNCLLGIAGAHTSQCPAIIPHPFDANIVCSAGADGIVKIWDCESASSFFSFTNTVDYGPVEPNDRGSTSGFLDGTFFPDGSGLVLTDDSGRVIIFDASKIRNGEKDTAPGWMKEQYFANDYYDLSYDSNGYCIERGSERPPHLAPVGARCAHGGAPFSAAVNEAFKKLSGPLPIDVNKARWHRQWIFSKACVAAKRRFSIKGYIVSTYDPATTMLVRGSDTAILPSLDGSEVAQSNRTQSQNVTNNNGGVSRLSSNWRWSDYNDILRENGNDDEEPDSDDEEFQLNEHRQQSRSSAPGDTDDSDEDELRSPMYSSPEHSGRRRRSVLEGDAEDSGEGEHDEFMSTNNTPSGPFIRDYDRHYFRMVSSGASVKVVRDWLRRCESNSSYAGRKCYAPQLGDTVVYIPRAHYESIAPYESPYLDAPWESFPLGTKWPVVRCIIRHVRYRFPFLGYLKADKEKNRSVVAILNLEVTGVPELSPDRRYCWPKPSFTAPPEPHVFEVKFFMNNATDFIIPFDLYASRLSMWEALEEENGMPHVEVFFAEDAHDEDPSSVPFRGHAVAVLNEQVRNGPAELSNPHLQRSGFGSIMLTWQQDGNQDIVSPWETKIIDDEVHSSNEIRPELTAEEMERIVKALDSVKSLDQVDEVFGSPVNELSFSDYSTRVEVPMDLTFISMRLQANYYGTKFSVVSDVKTIRENCAKYNGDNDELTVLANKMLSKFEEEALSAEELQSYREFEEQVKQAALQMPAARAPAQGVTRGHGRQAQSLFEQLSPPESRLRPRNGRQQQARSRATRSSSANVSNVGGLSANERRSLRGGLRGRREETTNMASRTGMATRGSARHPEHLSQSATNRSGWRDRTTATEAATNFMQRRPSRSTAATRSATNAVQLSDNGEVGLQRRSGRLNNSTQSVDPGDRAVSFEQDVAESSVESSPEQYTARTEGGPAQSDEDVSEARQNRRSRRLVEEKQDESYTNDDSESEPSDEENSEAEDEFKPAARPKTRPKKKNSDAKRSPFSDQARCSGYSDSEQESPAGSDSDVATPVESEASEGTEGSSEPESSPESKQPKRRTNRNANNRTSRAATRQSSPDSPGLRRSSRSSASSPDDSPSRRSSRAISSQQANYEDPGSSEFSSDAEGAKKPAARQVNRRPAANSRTRTQRNTSRQQPSQSFSPPGSPSARRSLRAKKSTQEANYHIPGSSDEEPERMQPAKRAAAKKRERPDSNSPPNRQAKRRKKERSSSAQLSLPAPKKWPEISLKQITDVSNEMLQRLGELDDAGFFAVPVAESCPDVADEYEQVIEHPMDFRTIQEERIQTYRSIRDLQTDLVLVFQNCLRFNQQDSVVAQLAQTMLDLLEEMFRDVCKDWGIRLR